MAKYDKETKFYWLQLKEDFFEEDSIEWLEEQENGHKYSLFYLKLCLKSLKTNGILIRKVGNMLVPYDNKKLAEMTRTPVDTVIVAMELLKGIGLIQILENGELYISQLENMIGSQSKSALKKQQQRLLKQQVLIEGGQEVDKCPPKIEIELEKEIDLDLEIKKEEELKNNSPKTTTKRFIKPTLEEVKQYCKERNNKINAEYFIDYYEANGWKVGKNSMKDWKAAIRNWERRENTTTNTKKPIREEIVPEWFNKEQKKEKMSAEDQAEVDELFKRFDEEGKPRSSFEERKKALEEKLKSKYGKKKSL